MLKRLWLSPTEVEELCGLSAGLLAKWRCYGKGPPYMKVGRLVRYKAEDLEEWFGQHSRNTSRTKDSNKERRD